MRGILSGTFVVLAIAAYACDSFEESNPTPAADAGDERSNVAPDGAAPSDAAVDGSTPCEGEPEWATTASAQTMRVCDGAAVNLLTDPKHCGRCNHSCGAEQCGNGTCAERKDDSDTAILSGVHQGALYYVRRPGGSFSATPHELRRFVPNSGPQLLASLGADAGDAGGETRIVSTSPSGDHVFLRTNTTLRRTSATASNPAVPEIIATLPNETVSAITADVDRVYVAVPSGNRIDQVFLDGGVSPFIANAPRPGEMRLAGGRLLWVSQAFVFFQGNASSLRLREGPTDKTLLDSLDKLGGPAVDGNDVYVARAAVAGAIVQIDLATGATKPFFEGELDNSIFALSVAVDATHVYWLKETGQSGATTEVWKRARCGGAAVRIGRHPGSYRLAVLGDRIFLGAEDGLYSIAK